MKAEAINVIVRQNHPTFVSIRDSKPRILHQGNGLSVSNWGRLVAILNLKLIVYGTHNTWMWESVMRVSFLMPALCAVAFVAVPASALSIITGPNSVSLDRTDDFSWTVNFAATSGTQLPGTTGSITFNFLSANAGGTLWNFSYLLDNTSVAPSASSRLGVFGFNTTGSPSGATSPAADRFDVALNGGNFNGLGNRDVCFYSGPNCNGSGNAGVTVLEAPVGGTFSLTFGAGLQTLVLDDFVARWQATGPNANGSNSGQGTIEVPAIPEPATWAMMIGGLALVGVSLRRRKVAVSFA